MLAASYTCIRRVLLCGRFDVFVRFCSTSSVLSAQARTGTGMGTCNPTDVPEILYGCRGSSVSVLPHGAQQCTQSTMRQTQQTQALQESLMYTTPSIESHQYHEHQRSQYQPSFHSHDPYQRHLYPASYSHHHPETSNCAQVPIETLYPLQFSHDPFGRLYRSLYVCLCVRYFLVLRAIWSMVSCCVRLVVRT